MNWWKRFVDCHIIAADPHPEYSRLDRADGLKVSNEPGGGHDITAEFAGQTVTLVRVRPVGTLAMGELRDAFAPEWVPELVEALQLAQRIADREKPWEPWVAVE